MSGARTQNDGRPPLVCTTPTRPTQSGAAQAGAGRPSPVGRRRSPCSTRCRRCASRRTEASPRARVASLKVLASPARSATCCARQLVHDRLRAVGGDRSQAGRRTGPPAKNTLSSEMAAVRVPVRACSTATPTARAPETLKDDARRTGEGHPAAARSRRRRHPPARTDKPGETRRSRRRSQRVRWQREGEEQRGRALARASGSARRARPPPRCARTHQGPDGAAHAAPSSGHVARACDGASVAALLAERGQMRPRACEQRGVETEAETQDLLGGPERPLPDDSKRSPMLTAA